VTRIYLSTNPSVDAGDILLERARSRHSRRARAAPPRPRDDPCGTAAGWYFVIAKADGDGTLAEVQEINNINYVWIQVFVP
jgi:hypothetical protein